MGRRRVNLQLLEKEKTRLLTFPKRKATLLKKASELSILCAVDVCVVIFGPNCQNDQCFKLETWPSSSTEVKRIVNKYRAQPRRRHHVSDRYFTDREKVINSSKVTQARERNLKARYPTWDARLDNLSADQYMLLLSRLNTKIEVAEQKLVMLKETPSMMNQAAPPRLPCSSWFGQNVSFHEKDYLMPSNENVASTSSYRPLVSNLEPFDVQMPSIRFQPGLGSRMITCNTGSGQSNSNNNCDPYHLQLFSFQEAIPFQFQQNGFSTCHSSLMDDADKELNGHNYINQLGGIRIIPDPGFRYDARPIASRYEFGQSINNADPSINYTSTSMMPLGSYMQYDPPGFPYRTHSSHSNFKHGEEDIQNRELESYP